MAGSIGRARNGQAEPFPSTSQKVFKSLHEASLANITLGKRTYSELNNTDQEGERPSTQGLGSAAPGFRNKILRTSPFNLSKPSTPIENSGNEAAMKARPPTRNDQPGDNNIRYKLGDKDYRDHQLSGNHEDNYRQLDHDDRSTFLKPPALSTAGHYTISKDYTEGEEVRRSHLLEIYGRKCGAKRGSLMFSKQQEETRKDRLRVTMRDGTKIVPSPSSEPDDTRQQGRVLQSLQGASTVGKKNSLFDIPEGRNLSNIDHLIAQSTDEREIKELKQQKRLLRNRQAALDSRQRKKQHTERLELEKEAYNALPSLLIWKYNCPNSVAAMTQLRLDKEEMIRSHTIETGELRKKISILTQRIERLQNPLS